MKTDLGLGVQIEIKEINGKVKVIKDNSMASDLHKREIW